MELFVMHITWRLTQDPPGKIPSTFLDVTDTVIANTSVGEEFAEIGPSGTILPTEVTNIGNYVINSDG